MLENLRVDCTPACSGHSSRLERFRRTEKKIYRPTYINVFANTIVFNPNDADVIFPNDGDPGSALKPLQGYVRDSLSPEHQRPTAK